MTKQITIKLNEEKFKPILNYLTKAGVYLPRTYSELVGQCLWFCYVFGSKKVSKFHNKTCIEMMAEMHKTTRRDLLLELLKKYNHFLKTGKP